MSEKNQIQADTKSLRPLETSFDQNPDSAHLCAFQEEIDAINRTNLTNTGCANKVQAAVAAEDRQNQSTAQDKQWHMEACRAFGLPSTATEIELDTAVQDWVDRNVRAILQLPTAATKQEIEEALSRLDRNQPSR